ENQDNANRCVRCGSALVRPELPARRQEVPTEVAPPKPGEIREADLATYPQRVSSFFIDFFLQGIPRIGFIPAIISLFFCRRGQTLGLFLVRARVVRTNGDVAGFYHTAVRNFAWGLSLLALGLGIVWALWDPQRQTWHDKLMHTYVLRDTPELATRKRSSAFG